MVDFLVIDADSHTSTTQEIWDTYMEKEYWDQRPRLIYTNTGRTKFMIQDTLYPHTDSHAPGLPGQREMGATRAGGDDVKMRLADMDANGVDVTVMLPAGPPLDIVRDPGLAGAIARARNNWLRDFCSEDPSRLRGIPKLPVQHQEVALAEIKRLIKEPWVAGILLPCSLQNMSLDNPYFRPFFQLAVEHDKPMFIHANVGASWAQPLPGQERLENFFESMVVTHPIEQMFAMMKLVDGGVLEEFRELRVGQFEAGAGWVPYWVGRIDEYFEHVGSYAPKMKRPASEYIKEGRFFFGVEAGDFTSTPMWRDWGWEDWVLFAWDYPHFDAILDGVVDKVMAREDMSLEQKRKFLNENAQRFYKFTNLPVKKKVASG